MNFCTFAEMGEVKEGYISSGHYAIIECTDNCKLSL